jgi:hypothetical protein
MSFDLYFLPRGSEESWEDAMARLEVAAESGPEGLSATALAQWERIRAAVDPVLPEATEYSGDDHRQLDDDATGIQLSLFESEVSLTVPYWYDGEAADRIVATLRAVVERVEEATGLVAYDPQAEASFLDEGVRAAPVVMAHAREALAEAVRRAEPPPQQSTSWWGRLTRRGR